MTRLPILGLALVGALVAACAVPDLQPSPTGRANAVCAQRFADPTIAPLRGRIPFSPIEAAQMSVGMLSDHRLATVEEQTMLRAFVLAAEECRRRWDVAANGVPDPVARMRAVVTSALADLIARKLSFAQYNRIAADAGVAATTQSGWAQREDYLGGILRWP
jgi:hypothetical protein